MQTHEIRKRFLDHFVKAGHTEVPSASVILDDPNLLFVNAGMVQFVPYFLGARTPPYPTATSIQKCIRTPDIDEVGITTRHNTFFQMAGNFSFGDYFKREAIELAWTLLTGSVEQGGYGLDPERIWTTVYFDDDEAVRLWQEIAGLPAERIQRRGMEDNYWSMGIPGPCGPSSEIYYDRGEEFGVGGGPIANEDRYVELWNLVFMQSERGEGTSKTDFEILGPLPRKNIDTGMGVERVAFVLQGVHNVYETDLLRPVIDAVAARAPRPYDAGNHDDDVRYRIIADHSRTAAILIGDGVTPGNDGRGYVLRRLLRRVIRSARLLDIEGPIVGDLMATVRDAMGPSYPELVTDFDRIARIAVAEETAFNRTLAAGSKLFDEVASTTKATGAKSISGSDAFTLHDTYGFPIELTLEMASEAGLQVDEVGFRELMAEQRRRAKADAAARKHAHADLTAYRELVDAGPTEFTGFDELSSEARILGIFVDGKRVPVVTHGGDGADRVELVLDRTPLYAESGGQIADEGTISGTGAGESARAAVTDVQKIAKTLWVHRVNVESGEFVEGDTVIAAVDPQWRRAATSAGAQRRSGGLPEPPGLPAFRLQLAGPADRGAAHPDRRGDQPGRAGRLRGAHLHRAAGEGQGDGGHRAVRRELPRAGAGGGDRRPVLAGALRRHARAQLRADRAGDHPGRILGRLRGAPGGGLRRAGLVPAPGQGTRADGGAGVVAEGAVGGGAGPGGQPGGAAAGRGEGTRADAAGLRAGRGRQRRRGRGADR